MTRASVFNVGEPGRKVREAAAAKEDSFDVNFGSALEDAKRQFIKSRERRRERDPVLKKTHTKKSRKDRDAVKVDEAQINYGLGSKDTTVYDAVAGEYIIVHPSVHTFNNFRPCQRQRSNRATARETAPP